MAAGNLTKDATGWHGNFSMGNQSQTINLDVGNQYVDAPIELIFTAQSGSATTPATTITANPTISVDSTGKITATASASQNVTPTISTGWVASGTAGTITVSGSGEQQLDKIEVGVDITGTPKVTPVISRTAKPAGETWIDAASGAATSIVPTTGAYVQVDAPAQTSTITSEGKVTSAGFGTTSYYDADTATSTEVGSNAAETKYIPIKTANPTFSGGSLNNQGASIVVTNATVSDTTNNSGVVIAAKGAAGRDAVTYNANTSGWVEKTSGDIASAAVTPATWNGTTYYLNSVTLNNNSSFDITVPNGSGTPVTFHFVVDSSGNTTITEG